MSKLAGNSRAALMGLLLAMVGFSYAIATTSDGAVGRSAGGRAIGSTGLSGIPLDFANRPILGDGSRDLGDAAAGSGFVRFVRAIGGVPPYRFSSSNGSETPSIGQVFPPVASFNSEVLLSGKVLGSTASGFALGPVKFQITVVDSLSGTNPNLKTESFTVTIVSANSFKFAVTALPDGVRLRPYVGSADVVGGNPDAREFSATIVDSGLPGLVPVGSTLDVIGLGITIKDGVIFGKPLVAGKFIINVVCRDFETGRFYAGRDGTGTSQNMDLTILANDVVGGAILTTAIAIKGDSAAQSKPKDSIKYAGLANIQGQALSTLAGSTIDLRIGAYRSPNIASAVLGANGKTVKPADRKATPSIKGSVSRDGKVKLAIAKETLGTFFNPATLVDKSVVFLSVSLVIGDAVSGSEILAFDVKKKGTKYQLVHKQGKQSAVAGAFMITKLTGKDSKGTVPADVWKIAFVAVPESKGQLRRDPPTTYGGPSLGVVSIGRNFTDSIAVAEKGGKVKQTDKRSVKNHNGVVKLGLNAKNGKSALSTGNVPASETGISEAEGGPATERLALGVELRTATAQTFAGEAGVSIFGKGKSWSTKNPNK